MTRRWMTLSRRSCGNSGEASKRIGLVSQQLDMAGFHLLSCSRMHFNRITSKRSCGGEAAESTLNNLLPAGVDS